MTQDTDVDVDAELRRFFKGLADATRLRMAGRLAAGPASAEELAAALDEKLMAVLHHLARLEEAGLVEGPAGAAQRYRLRLDAMHALAGRVFARPQFVVPEDAASEAYDRKVLKDYLTPNGTFKDLPDQPRKFDVLLRYAFRDVEAGRRYSEKEVNALLGRYHEDTARMRRAMIDYGWMGREVDGKAYWKREEVISNW